VSVEPALADEARPNAKSDANGEIFMLPPWLPGTIVHWPD